MLGRISSAVEHPKRLGKLANGTLVFITGSHLVSLASPLSHVTSLLHAVPSMSCLAVQDDVIAIGTEDRGFYVTIIASPVVDHSTQFFSIATGDKVHSVELLAGAKHAVCVGEILRPTRSIVVSVWSTDSKMVLWTSVLNELCEVRTISSNRFCLTGKTLSVWTVSFLKSGAKATESICHSVPPLQGARYISVQVVASKELLALTSAGFVVSFNLEELSVQKWMDCKVCPSTQLLLVGGYFCVVGAVIRLFLLETWEFCGKYKCDQVPTAQSLLTSLMQNACLAAAAFSDPNLSMILYFSDGSAAMTKIDEKPNKKISFVVTERLPSVRQIHFVRYAKSHICVITSTALLCFDVLDNKLVGAFALDEPTSVSDVSSGMIAVCQHRQCKLFNISSVAAVVDIVLSHNILSAFFHQSSLYLVTSKIILEYDSSDITKPVKRKDYEIDFDVSELQTVHSTVDTVYFVMQEELRSFDNQFLRFNEKISASCPYRQDSILVAFTEKLIVVMEWQKYFSVRLTSPPISVSCCADQALVLSLRGNCSLFSLRSGRNIAEADFACPCVCGLLMENKVGVIVDANGLSLYKFTGTNAPSHDSLQYRFEALDLMNREGSRQVRSRHMPLSLRNSGVVFSLAEAKWQLHQDPFFPLIQSQDLSVRHIDPISSEPSKPQKTLVSPLNETMPGIETEVLDEVKLKPITALSEEPMIAAHKSPQKVRESDDSVRIESDHEIEETPAASKNKKDLHESTVGLFSLQHSITTLKNTLSSCAAGISEMHRLPEFANLQGDVKDLIGDLQKVVPVQAQSMELVSLQQEMQEIRKQNEVIRAQNAEILKSLQCLRESSNAKNE